MKAKVPLLLLGMAIGLALILVVSGAGIRTSSTASTAAAATPDADAAIGSLVLTRCGSCHGIDTIAQHRQDAAGWTKTVDTMTQMGAHVAPNERGEIIAYLARHFAP